MCVCVLGVFCGGQEDIQWLYLRTARWTAGTVTDLQVCLGPHSQGRLVSSHVRHVRGERIPWLFPRRYRQNRHRFRIQQKAVTKEECIYIQVINHVFGGFFGFLVFCCGFFLQCCYHIFLFRSSSQIIYNVESRTVYKIMFSVYNI